MTAPQAWRGVIAEYVDLLPAAASTQVVTLGEGGTPLVASRWLSELTRCDVRLKVEAGNPTGSFKDRGMTVAVSCAVAEGAHAVLCASTGNTSASMAAYAARAGIASIVLVPEGRVAAGKLAQALVHGARVVTVRSGFDGCLRLAREIAEHHPVALVNSVNPMRLEGQKTAAFEIVDALGRVPDIHALPVGNAGNIAAYWKGFQEYAACGRAASTPRMWGFQAAGAAPLVSGSPIADPRTIASAIRIGSPASAHLAIAARDESAGLFAAVSDEAILAAQDRLAQVDGVFVEPASAAAAAGLVQAQRAGDLQPGQLVTITLTGHGLKDVDAATAVREPQRHDAVDPDAEAVVRAAGLTNAGDG